MRMNENDIITLICVNDTPIADVVCLMIIQLIFAFNWRPDSVAFIYLFIYCYEHDSFRDSQ